MENLKLGEFTIRDECNRGLSVFIGGTMVMWLRSQKEEILLMKWIAEKHQNDKTKKEFCQDCAQAID